MRPSARTGPVSLVSGRTKFNLSSSVVQVSPLVQRREDRAAERGIEQGRGEAAMHAADRIVVAKLRQALEHRAAVLGFDQVKVQQLGDRRLRQRAADDRFEKAEPVIGLEHLRRHDAVFLPVRAPRLNPVFRCACLMRPLARRSCAKAGTSSHAISSRNGTPSSAKCPGPMVSTARTMRPSRLSRRSAIETIATFGCAVREARRISQAICCSSRPRIERAGRDIGAGAGAADAGPAMHHHRCGADPIRPRSRSAFRSRRER